MWCGAVANVQYPHRSRHNRVNGTNTFGEYVTRVPVEASRTPRAIAVSSSVGRSSSVTGSVTVPNRTGAPQSFGGGKPWRTHHETTCGRVVTPILR